jgi:UDP-hydrolysing UDP-N-acetyl-D-glucosamine 2-epimerase
MLRVAIFLSNRATYYRHKALIQAMLHDHFVKPYCILASSLLDDSYKNTHDEIHRLFNAIDLAKLDGNFTNSEMATNSINIANDFMKTLIKGKFDAVGLIGDRWELLPAAMTASYLNIPIFHIQGGEDSGNIDQRVRHAVSMLSDIHFPSHKKAAYRLASMKLTNVFCHGCPSLDLIKGLGLEAKPQKRIICIFHPHTDEQSKAGDQTKAVLKHVSTFCKDKGYSLYWFAPNNDPGNNEVRAAIKDVKIIDNLVGEKFLELLVTAKMVVGNSSCAIRECSFLGIPAVNIGMRQKDRVCARNVINSGFNSIYSNMEMAEIARVEPSTLFGDGNSSEKIIISLREWLWEKAKESKKANNAKRA